MTEQDEYIGWLEEIEDNGVNLTFWETDFIESLRAQLDAGRRLSERQAEILERIYSQRTP